MNTDILNTFSKEDIQNQFEVFKKAKEFPSAFFSEKANLDFMINSYNKTADPENKIEIDSAIMNQTAGELDKKQREDIICKYKNGIYNDNTKIPTREEVCEKWSKDLNEVLKNCPSPEKRMKALVDDLTEHITIFKEDDWKKDTLRLRILKQFIKYGNGLQYTIKTEDEHGEVKDKRISIIQGMGNIRKYVEKQTGIEQSKLTEEDILAGVDDKIFAKLQYAAHDQMRPITGTYAILRMANDLASGRFGKNTKQYLYLFALVFGMRYLSEGEGKEYDIQTGLFDTYYLDEPLRYPGAGEERDVNYDRRLDNNKYWSPSGQGINPKDFKDVIYLYYLHSSFDNREGLKARVRDADQMIRRVAENKKIINTAAESHGTNTYLYSIMSEVLKIERKEELEEYIIKNYCVDEAQKQNSAFNKYRQYICILSELCDGKNTISEIENTLCELSKETVLEERFNEILGKETEQNNKKHNNSKRKEIEKILGGGLGINDSDKGKNSIITMTEKMLGSKIIEKPEGMTRSALVGAYYFYFIKADEAGLIRSKGFHEKLAAFTGSFKESEKYRIFEGIDNVLGEVWYAPTNPHNMFDSLVMLSIAYLEE